MSEVQPIVFHNKPTVFKGNTAYIRGDHQGAQVVTQGGLGRFGEAALKGGIYTANSTGLTLLTASGNTIGSSQAQSVTATGSGLVNLSTSTSAMVLQRVSLSIDSGTLAAGGVYHGTSSGNTVVSSLSGMARGVSTLIGGSAAAAQGWAFTKATSTTYTGAGIAAVPVRPFVGTTAAAITAGLPATLTEDLEGEIVLLPGAEYRLLFAAVGTTVIYNVGYTWMEVPLSAV